MTARNPQGIHRLSAAAVRYIDRPGWHADGGGLYLEVDPGGRKRWAMRLTVAGKRRDFGLGPLHKVSLLQARDLASEYRAKAFLGIDPTEGKKRMQEPRDQRALTFEVAAKQVHTQRRAAWNNGKHVDQWINTLRDHAFPFIARTPVNLITTADVLSVLSPIWNTKPETARRVKQRLATVLEWARAAGHRSGDNPVDLIGDALPRHKQREHHLAALPYTDVPQFIARLQSGHAEPITNSRSSSSS